MKEVIEILDNSIENEEFIHGVLSNLRRKDKKTYTKVDIRPVLLQDEIKYQFTFHYKDKVIHENLDEEDFKYRTVNLLNEKFRQGMFFTKSKDYQVLISKKNKLRVLEHPPSKKELNLSHNRKKEYILEDGKKIDFLIELGVMTKDGRVVAKYYDKFRQINRFLEFIEDIIPEIDQDKEINIVDFGCGRSYLTFALYYYLVKILDLNVNIVGLDLKKDVIDFCNKTASNLKYDKLEFLHGDIKDFETKKDVDLVVTLHACDIATDEAIIKAVGWNAKAILSVPCCQHEFFNKIDNDSLEPMLKHGIVKDKLSSLVTDSLRGLVLEAKGYKVQLLEFIDMEHTPKNILIRAVKSDDVDREKAKKEVKEFKDFWNLKDIYMDRIF